MLEELGFDVIETCDAAEALTKLESVEGISLLYTDIRMPGLIDGCDLAKACAERWPDSRIIVCSGCHPCERARLPSSAHFIAKPCAEKQVRTVLRALRLH
ncbi:response regulator [Methylobacterium sp. Leaf456]|uniref:response regulator n=1 Tax=Methylobacterium sp. Leaf456 TaxID=1736382 RepID=UPI00256FEE1F|nr:response regulator [Methylobacterium sp. Leaf456]